MFDGFLQTWISFRKHSTPKAKTFLKDKSVLEMPPQSLVFVLL